MKKQQAPQDHSRSYGGKRKLLYVTDEQGQYDTVTSNGWEVEDIVNGMAVELLAQQAQEAAEQVRAGNRSPLLYWMYHSRLDTAALAQAMGLFQWQVKRHFKPKVFDRLKPALLQRYASLFNISVSELCNYELN